ncbi:ABC transporter ATP-binding protein [Streptomyces sp. AC512_CC834]|uniref:ABC transporter ATP-binding protein n=1 Tax=Streptomyces sp. AC512_CC834 TaxID=2823691 RepID=UPI001C268E4E|nr:ATP-binding cassette domain-containing protein [Streptomyces sp. AC512_CC834]
MTAPGAHVSLLDVPEVSAHADGAQRPLLDRVALSVEAGGVTAVVGASGSGKTTLGLAVLGAAADRVRLTGRVLLAGTDLLLLPPGRRPAARAGVAAQLPQHPETVLDPVHRAGATLTELAALGHSGQAARRAAGRRALTSAGLDWDTVRRRFPHQLSGGQQQRLALASALVTGARLLVLDEPTSGLDPALTRALGRTVRALADDDGAGVLLLSHDLALVRETADRVVVLEHGRRVDHGPTADVLGTGGPRPRPGPAAARHRATRDLIAAERPTGPVRRAAGGVAAPAPEALGEVTASGVAVRRRTGDLLTGPVSMTFAPGSRTALLGPSGSGKTTFARVLAGLTTPTLGEVRFAGRPLARRLDRRSTAERRVVQYVHQSSAGSFEAHRPILDQLADTARLLRDLPNAAARAGATEAAEELGLDEELLHRTPDRLSGGQLQRCALVRALTARPALLVCDEVTSALDTVSRQRVLDALPRLLAPAGTALLFISHDLPAVRALAEETVLLDAGAGLVDRCPAHHDRLTREP